MSVARELAEAEGWDAVTTRRLAERIEYSQPVLYSHFRGKDEIVGAVALEGFAELTATIRNDVPANASPREAVTALATSYLDFASRHPAVYDAMFSLSSGLPFGDTATPSTLREAFEVLRDTLSDSAGQVDPELYAEVSGAALQGLATLTRAGRLPPVNTPQRLDVIGVGSSETDHAVALHVMPFSVPGYSYNLLTDAPRPAAGCCASENRMEGFLTPDATQLRPCAVRPCQEPVAAGKEQGRSVTSGPFQRCRSVWLRCLHCRTRSRLGWHLRGDCDLRIGFLGLAEAVSGHAAQVIGSTSAVMGSLARYAIAYPRR